MTILAVVRVMALLSSGIMAGLLFGDWLGPSFARAAMRESSFIEFQQIVHLRYLLVLPALSSIAAGLPVLWLVLRRRRRDSPEFKLVLGAVVAIMIGFTITLVFNVPVNEQLEVWSLDDPPANARQIWKTWEQAHVVRTIFWMSGFVLEAAALPSSVGTVQVDPDWQALFLVSAEPAAGRVELQTIDETTKG